jgi:16S rRNA (uracil1498-N3)-methyltransferase
MQLFYSSQISGNHLVLSEEEASHASRVLRLKENDEFHATDGKGHIFKCRITLLGKKEIMSEIVETAMGADTASKLHIAIAPTKNIDRLEWFLEKATEFGIGEITPIICDRSERKEVRIDRLEKIIFSAMKQSLKTYLPQLNEALRFKEFLTKAQSENKFIAHCLEDEKKELFSLSNPEVNTLVLIGPEGDFSPNEIQLALSSGFLPVSLGKSRLRTETAGVAVAHMFSLK